jgi:hypothetical protein
MSITTNDTTKSPEYYFKELDSLKQRFSIILNKGKNAVPLSTTYPTNQNYKKMVSEYKTSLKEYKNDFFMLNNEIEQDMETFEKTSEKTADYISDLEKKNKELKDDITELVQSNNGTKGLLKDTQLLYNQYLLGNVYLFTAIVAYIYYYFKH